MGSGKTWVLTQLGYQLAYPSGPQFPYLKDGDEEPQSYFLLSHLWEPLLRRDGERCLLPKTVTANTL